MERRFKQSMERCSRVSLGKTHRPEQSRFWVALAGYEAGRVPGRHGFSSEGDRQNIEPEKTTDGKGIHAAGDDDRAPGPVHRCPGIGGDAGRLSGVHAGLAIRLHRTAEGGGSGRSDLYGEVYE